MAGKKVRDREGRGEEKMSGEGGRKRKWEEMKGEGEGEK